MLYSAPEPVEGSPQASQRLSFHPFVRSAPSFHPDLREASAVARSGCQGWPAFGPPRQRRAASLTAVSTAARSVASGNRSAPAPNRTSKSECEAPSKSVLTLTSSTGQWLLEHFIYEAIDPLTPLFKPLIWTSFNIIWKSHVWKSHSLLEHAWSKSSSTGQFNWPMAIETLPYSVGSGYRTSPTNCNPVHGSGPGEIASSPILGGLR